MNKKRSAFARKVARRAREKSPRGFSLREDHRPSYVLLPVTLHPPTPRRILLFAVLRPIAALLRSFSLPLLLSPSFSLVFVASFMNSESHFREGPRSCIWGPVTADKNCIDLKKKKKRTCKTTSRVSGNKNAREKKSRRRAWRKNRKSNEEDGMWEEERRRERHRRDARFKQ